MKRHYGYKFQEKDARDWKFDFPHRLQIPQTIDLDPLMGPLLDQLALGACGPNTLAELICFDFIAEKLAVAIPSRLYLYYNCRKLMGTLDSDSGVDNRTLLKALARNGYCPEVMWPYDIAKFTEGPPESCYRKAADRHDDTRECGYHAVKVAMTDMLAALTLGRPFMFGFNVYEQMESDEAAATGILALPSGTSIGGHDVTINGHTSVDRPGKTPGKIWPANTFRFRNHWTNSDGKPWGDAGDGYIPDSYATNVNEANDFWVVDTIPI